LFIFIGLTGYAQPGQLSNQRTKVIDFEGLTQKIDSLPLVEGSVKITLQGKTQPVASHWYRVSGKQLIWQVAPDSLANVFELTEINKDSNWYDGLQFTIQYRVLPYDLEQSLSHLDSNLIQQAASGDYIGFDFSPYEPSNGISDFKGLDYSGSFSRGISFGNNQNLVLNSNFNLQMAGNVGDDIEILAAITDQNIPLQAEGNTQQLQEFDKIFIQLKRKNNMLIAGDYELQRPNSYFMNYFKKLQGATFSNQSKVLKNGTLTSRISGAIAKGKFARNLIEQQEGNQGPYRLQGNLGERFIIALAGTEKVYIDGALMRRGIEEDYIIDYNRADVTFTNKRLITKDSRIIVEFEYADQNYLRSMYAFNTEFENKKWRVYFNLFSEQDSKTSGGASELDSLQRSVLQNAGDSIDTAFSTGIDTIQEFSEFQVKYKLVDTTYMMQDNGSVVEVADTILVYSTHPDSAFYTSSFTEVGFGNNGNYILDPSIPANGRVYRWVAPDVSGISTGNYAPILKLTAPNLLQLYTAGATYQISKNAGVDVEVAMSNNDPNRFSKKDEGNDLGIATLTRFRYDKELGTNWNVATNASYEMTQKNFKALNPYRDAEFNRDWNLVNSLINANQKLDAAAEQLAGAGLQLNYKKLGSIEYNFNTFLRKDIYNGVKHSMRTRLQKNGFVADLQGSLLTSDSDKENSTFFRPKGDIYKTFSKWNNLRLGVHGEREKNSRMNSNSDTLNNSSFHYDLYKFYFESNENEKISFGANYTQRYDYAPLDSAFSASTFAEEFNLNGRWRSGKNSNLGWNLTYRNLEIRDSLLSNQDPQKTFLGRLEHSMSLFDKLIRSSTNYEISSGQEPKIEYQYVPVENGQGNYQWDDLNQDSTVQLDEIQEIAFQDQGNAIRVTLFTNEFIRTHNVALNQSLHITPPYKWKQGKGFKKAVSRFSTHSILIINRRTRQADEVVPWNPFQLAIADTSLVSINSRIRNTLYFNRGHETYDLQAGMLDNRSKIVLVSGFESRRTQEQYFRSRWNITRKLSWEFRATIGKRFTDSEFFNNRDYNIRLYKLEPKLTFQPSQKFRVAVGYKFEDSQNQLTDASEKAGINNVNLELVFKKSISTALRINGSYAKVTFDGEANSPIEFAMLQGLNDGQNFLWNIVFDRRLSNNIQLNISYEGRKTGTADPVHIGRAQIRAAF